MEEKEFGGGVLEKGILTVGVCRQSGAGVRGQAKGGRKVGLG